MGTIGSKEKLSQIVVVYGYNHKDFPWRTTIERNIYHTSGLIISCGEKKYLLTRRNGLAGCNNIVMHYSHFNDNETVFRNNLSIIFQSMEYNIMILGTVGKNELDLSASEIVTGTLDNKSICDSYDILNKKISVPTTRSRYYTAILDTNLEKETLHMNVDVYVAKFRKGFIHDKTYLPKNYMYKFQILQRNNAEIFGIYGAAVFNKKLELIGIITETSKNMAFVLPTKMLQKIVTDFIGNLENTKKYMGPRALPFDYKVSKKIGVKIMNIHETHDKKNIKENDIICSINGKEIIIIDTIDKKMSFAALYENSYQTEIPLDIYLRLNLKQDVLTKMTIKRLDKIHEVEILNVPSLLSPFAYTAQPYYFPGDLLPYMNANGVIVVELTHELIHIIHSQNIKIKNNILEMYFQDKLVDFNKYFIIIDCLNTDLTKKYDLPQWNINDKKYTIYCPTVKKINQKNISSLDDIHYDGTKCTIETIMFDGTCKEIEISSSV
jgi:hypothetical protein